MEVKISIPFTNEEVSDFVEDIFQLTEVRIKADQLSADFPEERDVFPEGRIKERKHKSRERNSKVVTLANNEQFTKYDNKKSLK